MGDGNRLAGAMRWGGLAVVVSASLVGLILVSPPHNYWMSPLLLAGGLLLFFAAGTRADVPAAAPPAATARLPATAATHTSTESPALQAEVDELRQVQQELIKAKHDAEAAMMAKSEFLATMSHEIRTPLNGVIPLLDIVLSTKLAADQRDYLLTAYRSARELLRIVDDILDYSKIEANKLELEAVGINLREVLDAVKRLMEKNAEGKGLAFSISIDPAVRLAVRGDPVRLRQVLTNLVSNAIKFTERGSVSVRVSRRGETRTHNDIMFQVQDSGVGIAPESAEKLFLPFSQADASTTRIHGGTGLGLVICKRIVDLMGGKIGVKSELGRGSTFWFSVPFLKAVGDGPGARTDLSGSRALLVVDDAAAQRRISGYLSSWGMPLTTTNVAAEALAKLRSAAQMGDNWAVEVLIVDLASMRGNPVALLRNVLREPALTGVRIAFLAGNEDIAAELRQENRATVVANGYADADLRRALNVLLGVQQGNVREELAAAAEEMPDPGIHIAAPATAATPLRGHVLLVEDNPVNRQVAQRILSLLGLSLELAENGKEALEKLDASAFDLVLMDCQMPVMDGYTATRIRRSREAETRQGRIPIIAMTANAMAGDREKCLAAGMDEYLSKPMNRGLLETTLRKWLPKQAQSRTPAETGAVSARAVPTPAIAALAAMATGPAVALGDNLVQADPQGIRDGAALDQEIVRDLLDVMGEEFTELVGVYLEDTPKNLALLESAAARNDPSGLIAPSHSLKSTSANLGAMTLAEIAKRIEHEARAGTLVNPANLVRELVREYGRVSAELRNLLVRSGA
ncbi:Hpt sensor hybrid histidine kinase [Tahibacter aquaticus]|uniref:Sensory/regulatory protein RpfC n=1 Tax=Tahibacter aquaticus TaxID=520092 RepID=A0A4R6YVJ1_9GAMM|nr:ATP-binding protein [Tahibacter aquaticus]TDR42499.1 Hpt sensor hybrid histidine kinase [Tahibacter aquaticus]